MHQKSNIIALVACIFFSSTSQGDNPQAQKANQDIMLCQYKAAMDLDDGVSDINSLAPYIADSCKQESERFYQLLRGTIKGPVDERSARAATRDKDLKLAAKILLRKRADDRKGRRP